MDKTTKVSSLKVGALTLVALLILIFTVLWIKGRSLSAGERIEVIFKDINGMRAGSGVQMMGFRVGQVEEIEPVINGKDSHVRLRFVITEKDVKIPDVSTISIQQSGIIGEQFLEVTPPKVRTLYTGTDSNGTKIIKGDNVFMDFNGQLRPIANVVNAEVVQKYQIPAVVRDRVKTKNALKIDYMINLPGLILDPDSLDAKFTNHSLVFYVVGNYESPKYPETKSKYTVIEPMRLSDFMDLQYKSARALNETNDKISQILSQELIYEVQESVKNVNNLTSQALTTLGKAEALIDTSRQDISSILKQSDQLINKLTTLAGNVNDLVGDTSLKEDLRTTAKSVTRLSDNVNSILEDKNTKEIISNMDEISRNLADISLYVNEFTKDEKLKKELKNVVYNLNNVTESVNHTLKSLNELDDCEKVKLKDSLADITVITRNLKTFTKKLNKRFLLFRLMF